MKPSDVEAMGKTTWVIPGGHIPVHSSGPEPEFTSCDMLAILNTGPDMASVEMFLYYSDREPVGPYRVTVAPRRTKRLRFNDFIAPEAIPLGEDYAALISSSVPVVIGFCRQDTRREALALLGTLAFPVEGA